MTAKRKWDIKRGNGVYGGVNIQTIKDWIKKGKIKEGEVEVWTSGMSGWRKPEELDEFKKLFKKRIRK